MVSVLSRKTLTKTLQVPKLFIPQLDMRNMINTILHTCYTSVIKPWGRDTDFLLNLEGTLPQTSPVHKCVPPESLFFCITLSSWLPSHPLHTHTHTKWNCYKETLGFNYHYWHTQDSTSSRLQTFTEYSELVGFHTSRDLTGTEKGTQSCGSLRCAAIPDSFCICFRVLLMLFLLHPTRFALLVPHSGSTSAQSRNFLRR